MESSNKQATFGKMFQKLVVVDKHSKRISFKRALLRNVIKSLFLVSGTSVISLVMLLFTQNHRAIHDLISGTIVLRKGVLLRQSVSSSRTQRLMYHIDPAIEFF